MRLIFVRNLMLFFVTIACASTVALAEQEKLSQSEVGKQTSQSVQKTINNSAIISSQLQSKTKFNARTSIDNINYQEKVLVLQGLHTIESNPEVATDKSEVANKNIFAYSIDGVRPTLTNTFYLPIDDNVVLDPAFATDLNSLTILQNIYETLVSYDSDNKLSLDAAKSYQVSDDGLRWQFVLKDNLRWSDGSAVTANDFIDAWQRLVSLSTMAPNSHLMLEANIVNAFDVLSGQLAADQLGIEAVDDYTINIALTKPTPWLLSILASPALSPLHESTIKRNTESGNVDVANDDYEIISNGAYNFVHNENIPFILVKNNFYWDKDNVYFQFIGGASTYGYCGQFPDYVNNKRNVVYVTNINRERVTQKYAHELKTIVYPETKFVEFNLRDEVVSNNSVRKAINYLLDRQYFAAHHHTSSVVASSLAPANILDGSKIAPDERVITSNASANVAGISLLKQLGYSQENPLVLKYIYSTDFLSENPEYSKITFHEQLTNILETNSQNIIKVETTGYSNKEYFEVLREGKFQLTGLAWRSAFNHAHSFYGLFSSNDADNFANYSSDDYDSLLVQIEKETDKNKRATLYAQAQEILNRDLPIIPLIWSSEQYVIHDYVTDLKLRNFTGLSVKDIGVNQQLLANFINQLNSQQQTLVASNSKEPETNKATPLAKTKVRFSSFKPRTTPNQEANSQNNNSDSQGQQPASGNDTGTQSEPTD